MSETDNIFEGVEEDIVTAIKTKAVSGTRKTTVSGNFNVTGKTTLNDLCVTGNAVYDNLSANNFDISGNLTVDGLSTLANACIGNLTVKDDSDLCGNVLINCVEVTLPVLNWSARVDGDNGVGSTNEGFDITARNTNVFGIGKFDNFANVHNSDDTIFKTLTAPSTAAYIAKWDSSGDAIWATRIEGTRTFGSGNPSKYNMDSDANSLVFVSTFDAPRANVYNSDDTLFKVVDSASTGLCVVNYDDDGNGIWASKATSIATIDVADVSIQNSNVYVGTTYTGTTTIYNSDDSIFGTFTDSGSRAGMLVKWDSTGNVIWAAEQDSTTAADTVSIDTNSNAVYIGGVIIINMSVYNSDATLASTRTIIGGGFFNTHITKYDNDGFWQWTAQMNHLSNSPIFYKVKTDPVTANVYFASKPASSSSTSLYNSDNTFAKTVTAISLFKYDSSGFFIWDVGISPGATQEFRDIIVYDTDVYTTGQFGTVTATSIINSDGSTFLTTTPAFTNQPFILKCNADGFCEYIILLETENTVSTLNSGFGIYSDSTGIYATGAYDNSGVIKLLTPAATITLGSLKSGTGDMSYIIKLNDVPQFVQKNSDKILQICSDTVIDKDLTVNGDLNFDTFSGTSGTIGDLTVTGSLSLNIISANTATFEDLNVNNDTTLFGNLVINCDKRNVFLDWAAKVDGTNFSGDEGRSISADSTAVYATGLYRVLANVFNADGSVGANLTSTGEGAYIAKWNSDGTVDWATKVDGSSVDRGLGISVNSANVYATGLYNTSAGVYNANNSLFKTLTATGQGAYITKWDSSGNAVWAAKVDGTFTETGEGIVADSSGIYATGAFGTLANIYNADDTVATSLTGAGTISGYIAKWNTDGNVSWATKVDGPGNDQGFGIAVTSESVYGTGLFTSSVDVYSVNGTVGASLTSSGSGVYVAKWDNTGIFEWAAKVDGSSTDQGYSVAADSSAVYVTGSFTTSASIYNKNGTVGTSLTATGLSAYLAKWDNSGTVEWATKIDGSTSSDGRSVTIYNDNIYLTGYYNTSVTIFNSDNTVFRELTNGTGVNDYSYIVKWDSDGNGVWVLNITDSVGNRGFGISVNDLGEIYSTGFYNDLLTIELITSTETVFRGTLSAPTNRGAYILKISELEKIVNICSDTTIDSDLTVIEDTTLCGNVSINCEQTTSNASLSSNWSARIDGSSADTGLNIDFNDDAVYASGLYASGVTIYNSDNSVGSTLAGTNDVYVAKYNSDGTVLWSTRVDAVGASASGISSVSSNVYLLGTYNTSGTIYNSDTTVADTLIATGSTSVYLSKWDDAGQYIWSAAVISSTIAAATDFGSSVKSDESSVYATGYYSLSANIYDSNKTVVANLTAQNQGAFIVKWDDEGSVDWATKVDCPSFAEGRSISINTGDVYGIGSFITTANVFNSNNTLQSTLTSSAASAVYIAKWNSSGTAQWSAKIDGPVGSGNPYIGQGISSITGDVYVTGEYEVQANLFSQGGSVAEKILTTPEFSLTPSVFVAKYSSLGSLLWATKIDGFQDQHSRDITDGTDGVYVTGDYSGSGAGITIYNSNGLGEISIPVPTFAGAYIVKWDLDGFVKWAVTINNAAISNIGNGIKVDSSGDVYCTGTYNTGTTTVTGYINNEIINLETLVSVTNTGAYIIKLSQIEETLNTQKNVDKEVIICSDTTINGVLSICDDVLINCKETSSDSFSLDWSTRVDGSGADTGLNIDFNDGIVYGSGLYGSSATIYNSDGSVGSTLVGTGDVYVAKWNSDGTVLWSTRIDVTGQSPSGISSISSNVYVLGVYVNTGTIYNSDTTTADTFISAPLNGVYLSKWDSAGQYIWSTTVISPTFTFATDFGSSVKSDISSVYTTGYYETSANIYDSNKTIVANLTSQSQGAFIIKWDNGGSLDWATKVDSPDLTEGRSISINNGDVYGIGYFETTANVYNSNDTIHSTLTTSIGNAVYIAKWDSLGTARWSTKIDGPATVGTPYLGQGISSITGDVYVTGEYEVQANLFNQGSSVVKKTLTAAGSAGTTSVFVAKYNSSGTLSWVAKVDGTGNQRSRDISDSIDGVYVTGSYAGSTTVYNSGGGSQIVIPAPTVNSAFIIKWDLDGLVKWVVTVNNTGTNNVGNSLKVDSSGDVYCTGTYEPGTTTVIGYINNNTLNLGNLVSVTNTGAYIIKLSQIEEILYTQKNEDKKVVICSDTTIIPPFSIALNNTQSSAVCSYIREFSGETLAFNIFQVAISGSTGAYIKLYACGERNSTVGASKKDYFISYNGTTISVLNIVNSFGPSGTDLIPFSVTGSGVVLTITSGAGTGTFTGTIFMEIYKGFGLNSPQWIVSEI